MHKPKKSSTFVSEIRNIHQSTKPQVPEGQKDNMRTYFDRIVSATGKDYYIERSISGYYRLMLDGEPVFDDSATEELNEDRETAEAFFANYLLEYVVPEDKKTIKNGIITLL